MNCKHIYWRLQSKSIKLAGYIFRWFPVKRNKIVFNNFHGKGYGDSPKYVAEEILRQGLAYDMVWLVNDIRMSLPPEIRKVCLNSLRASYELSTARVVISNVKVALPYQKKGCQYYIQTWHGSMAFKAIEKDAQDKLAPQYVKESIHDSKLIDLFLSSNSIQTQEIKDSFWYDGEILESGSPRNDMLYKSMEYQIKIKEDLGVAGKKLILYAPTFRDDFRMDVYNLDLEMIKKQFDARFGGEWQVLVRLHPNVMGNELFPKASYISDVTMYPDMQELLLISDVLITDYSTVIYDAAIMHKQIFLYAPDLDDYKNNRGLKSIYFKLPTQINKSNEELLEYISQFDIDNYQKELGVFLDGFRVFDNGHASKCVVNRIKSIMNQ